MSDASKFDYVSSVTFAALRDAVILTDKKPEGYQDCDNILEIKVDKEEFFEYSVI